MVTCSNPENLNIYIHDIHSIHEIHGLHQARS